MSDIRVSGLTSLTTDAIGSCAIIAASNDGPENTPSNPAMSTADRLAYLKAKVADVEQEIERGADFGALQRKLMMLGAAAGMWVDGMTAVLPLAPDRRKAPQVRPIGQRTPSDPGIDFGDEDA